MIGGGSPIINFDPSYTWWGTGWFLTVPVPVIIFFIVAVTGYMALVTTPYGRHVYAVGGNPRGSAPHGIESQQDSDERLCHHGVSHQIG